MYLLFYEQVRRVIGQKPVMFGRLRMQNYWPLHDRCRLWSLVCEKWWNWLGMVFRHIFIDNILEMVLRCIFIDKILETVFRCIFIDKILFLNKNTKILFLNKINCRLSCEFFFYQTSRAAIKSVLRHATRNWKLSKHAKL